jgi:lycopene cyclase CruA
MQTYPDDQVAHYPHLSATFASIPNGEAHLRRLQDLNATWQHMLLSGSSRQYSEVVVTEEQPVLSAQPAVDTFDIIYAGGGLNLLNAAVMTRRYGLRVLVFDRLTVGAVHREWNISRTELQELLDVGLLTPEELESVIQREYRDGLVRFHPEHIQVPSSELHLTGVLDVAVDAEKLTALCIRKILETQPGIQHNDRHNGRPNVILHNTTFVRCTVQPSSGVTVDVTSADGEHHSYAANLLIDGMGSTSPIACQLNCGRPFSLVCPTVGTVARGYKVGSAPDAINPQVGEVLVTTEDARHGRQLIWEAFPGKDDQVAIYLFYYAEAGDRVDLLELFDNFFQLLPTYKDTSSVEILKPVYGFIPAGYNISLPWQRQPKVLAYDRVLSLGDAAAFQSPLTFCGFGSYVRNLRRITALLALALRYNRLSAADLNQIRASEAVPAVARAFSKFMIAKAETTEPAWQVNETLNVFCHVLNKLGPGVTNAFFKDRIGWLDYTRVVLSTPGYYPRIYTLAFRTLSLAEAIGWITAWLQLARQSVTFALYRPLKPLILLLISLFMAIGSQQPTLARLGLRLAILRESMEQVGRGQKEFKGHSVVNSHLMGRWLSHLWPRG